MRMLSVSADDLALALYLRESVDYGERIGGRYPDARCAYCGKPAGAHYCAVQQAAVQRLRDAYARSTHEGTE